VVLSKGMTVSAEAFSAGGFVAGAPEAQPTRSPSARMVAVRPSNRTSQGGGDRQGSTLTLKLVALSPAAVKDFVPLSGDVGVRSFHRGKLKRDTETGPDPVKAREALQDSSVTEVLEAVRVARGSNRSPTSARAALATRGEAAEKRTTRAQGSQGRARKDGWVRKLRDASCVEPGVAPDFEQAPTSPPLPLGHSPSRERLSFAPSLHVHTARGSQISYPTIPAPLFLVTLVTLVP
jgi:hypothetical protein